MIKHLIARGIPVKTKKEVVIFYHLLVASQNRGPICLCSTLHTRNQAAQKENAEGEGDYGTRAPVS